MIHHFPSIGTGTGKWFSSSGTAVPLRRSSRMRDAGIACVLELVLVFIVCVTCPIPGFAAGH
jgi:hypothetical protein